MKPEFEEKTYENLMNIMFACDLNAINIFSPGQRLEKYLGFDVGMYIKKWNKYIEAQDLKKLNKNLEDFCLSYSVTPFNLFIQYKRSDFCRNKKCICYSFWKKDFYRFKIYRKMYRKRDQIYYDQHQVLNKLEQIAKQNALVVYAAPTFHTYSDLFFHFNKKTLITNSVFCKVSKLNDHHYLSFIKNNNYGYACSQKEKIKLIDIKNELEKVMKNYKMTLFHQIKKVIAIIDKSMQISEKEKEENNINFIKQKYQQLILDSQYNQLSKYEMLFSMYKVKLFQILTNTTILWINLHYNNKLREKTFVKLSFI